MTHIPTELRPLLERCAKRLAAMMQGDLSRELEALLADHSEDALGLVAQPAAQAVSGAGFDYSIKTATSDSIGKPNAPADGEAVEVVGWMHSATRSVTEDAVRASTWISECVSPLMTVAQHQRIVAQLGQKVECRECERKQREIDLLWSDRRKDADLIHQLRTALAYFQPTVRQLAETSAELRAELSALKARQVEQEPAGEVHLWTGGGISLLHVELAQPLPPGTKLYTAPQPAPAQGRQVECHPDDAAVDRFAEAMKAKLAKSREKGRHGWQNCTAPHLSAMLYDHLYKADPLDVGNFAMMLHQNGQAIELPSEARGRHTTPQPAPAQDVACSTSSKRCPACRPGRRKIRYETQ